MFDGLTNQEVLIGSPAGQTDRSARRRRVRGVLWLYSEETSLQSGQGLVQRVKERAIGGSDAQPRQDRPRELIVTRHPVSSTFRGQRRMSLCWWVCRALVITTRCCADSQETLNDLIGRS